MSSKKGVSLPELLAVVVIMGIVATITIPLVGNIIKNTKKKAVVGDLISLSEAARIYCVSNDPTGVTSFCVEGGSGLDIVDLSSKIVVGDPTTTTNQNIKAANDLMEYYSAPFTNLGDKILLRCKTKGSSYEINLVSGKYTTNGFVDPKDDGFNYRDLEELNN